MYAYAYIHTHVTTFNDNTGHEFESTEEYMGGVGGRRDKAGMMQLCYNIKN